MRARSWILAGLLLVVVIAPALAKAPAWVLYTHPDKLMSVRFPHRPTETEQDAPSAIGNIHFKVAMFADDSRVYLATAMLYPVKGKFNVKAALDGGRDQALANIKGTLTSERAMKLDGFEGREVAFEATAPNSMKMRGVLRIFASARPPSAFIATAMRPGDKPDPDAATFLASFHLGKKVENR